MIRRAAPSLGVVVAVSLVLAGCAQPAAEPTAWQQSVQTVAEQASAGDYASALASLDALEADVTARRDAGEITAAEADAILARIATVRADLTSLAPAPSPTPTDDSTAPEETAEPSETGEPSETAEPEPSGTTEPTPDDSEGGADEETPSNGNGNKGPGAGGPGAKDDKKPGDGASPDPGKKDG